MTPKQRIAKTNIAATDAICWMPARDELSRRQAEAAGNRGGRGDHDECHERRRDPAHDEREQETDSGEAQQREHGQRIISAVSPKVN